MDTKNKKLLFHKEMLTKFCKILQKTPISKVFGTN